MDLLDYLADGLHCQYLSDLRIINADEADLRRLLDDAVKHFPPEQFIETAGYLFGGDRTELSSLEQARRVIMEYLTKKND